MRHTCRRPDRGDTSSNILGCVAPVGASMRVVLQIRGLTAPAVDVPTLRAEAICVWSSRTRISKSCTTSFGPLWCHTPNFDRHRQDLLLDVSEDIGHVDDARVMICQHFDVVRRFKLRGSR